MRCPPVKSGPVLIYPDSDSKIHVWDIPPFQLIIQSLSVDRKFETTLSSVWCMKRGGRGKTEWDRYASSAWIYPSSDWLERSVGKGHLFSFIAQISTLFGLVGSLNSYLVECYSIREIQTFDTGRIPKRMIILHVRPQYDSCDCEQIRMNVTWSPLPKLHPMYDKPIVLWPYEFWCCLSVCATVMEFGSRMVLHPSFHLPRRTDDCRIYPPASSVDGCWASMEY
jgi:hypothetical protein